MALPRWLQRWELYAICLVWPVATVTMVVASYRLFLWSYGGRDCFRYVVIEEPYKGEWYAANPKTAVGMDTPLAHVPKFLETAGHTVGDDGDAAHPHHRNF